MRLSFALINLGATLFAQFLILDNVLYMHIFAWFYIQVHAIFFYLIFIFSHFYNDFCFFVVLGILLTPKRSIHYLAHLLSLGDPSIYHGNSIALPHVLFLLKLSLVIELILNSRVSLIAQGNSSIY